MIIELGTTLYARGTTAIIECIGKPVNQTGIVGIGISKYRHGETPAPKISTVATLADLLFQNPKSFSAYSSSTSDLVYVEINGVGMAAGGDSIYLPNDGDYKFRHTLIAEEVRNIGMNEEQKENIEQMKEVFKTTGTVNPTNVFLMCDSFYYGYAKNQKTLNKKELDIEVIKAAFKNGDLKPVKLFDGLGLGKSQYEKEARQTPKMTQGKETEDFLSRCKLGEYVIPYSWDSSVSKYIVNKKYLDTFETTPEFEEIVKKIHFRANKILERMDMGLPNAEAIGRDALNILLLGKPGTGKTTLAYALSAALQMPVCTTIHNKHTEEDEYEGKTKIIEGHPSFVETDALLFHQYGGIDICEEINLADPSVTMGGLGQKLEYPYIVKKNGYETIVRHPLNIVLATMNVGTNGSNPLNQALLNRFRTPFILDDPTKKTFVNILMKSSGKSKKVCEWVYNVYEGVKDYLKSPAVNEEDVCQNLSIRTCLGCMENMDEGQEPRRAVSNSIVGAIAAVDIELARKLQKEMVDCITDPSYSRERIDWL